MEKTDTPELVLEAGRSSRHYWGDLWRYRELLGFLAWRDIKVRYKQAALGVAWAVIQPAVQTILLTFVFGKPFDVSMKFSPFSEFRGVV